MLPLERDIGAGDQTTLLGEPEVPMMLKVSRDTVLVHPTEGVIVGTVLVTAQATFDASVAPEQEVNTAW